MLIDFHLYLWSFGDSEKPHVWPLGSRLGKGEIYNRKAARQTTEKHNTNRTKWRRKGGPNGQYFDSRLAF